MEKLFDVFVEITGGSSVKGKNTDVNMLDFTGKVMGKYFIGEIIGKGTDTQHCSDGHMCLSARYMLEGIDLEGQHCRIFIENNGSFDGGFVPTIVTDSKALSHFEDVPLKAEVVSAEKGVRVSLFA